MRAPNNVGGAEVAAWEALLEMESLDPNVTENANAAATMVVDQPKALKKVQRIVVWQRNTWFKFPQRVFRVHCGYIAHERTG